MNNITRYAARTRVKKVATLVSRSCARDDSRAVQWVMSSTARGTAGDRLLRPNRFRSRLARCGRRRCECFRRYRGSSALLLHRRRDAGRDAGELTDDAGDRGDFLDRALGRLLDGGDLPRDIVGGARGLVGERLHFGGDHGKALAGFAGARRLDGGVERQQIGLRRDRGNGADHRADAFGGVGERADGLLGCARYRRPRTAPCRARGSTCWPISWIDPDSSSVARTMTSMCWVVSAEADEAEAMRRERVAGDRVQASSRSPSAKPRPP